MKVPCKDCEDRYEACHDKCKKYQAFKAEREEISRKRKKDHEFTRAVLPASVTKWLREELRRRK